MTTTTTHRTMECSTESEAAQDGYWAGLGGEDLDDYPRRRFASEALWQAFLEGFWSGLDRRQFERWVDGE